jgi:lysophospholipase L1-like esterase
MNRLTASMMASVIVASLAGCATVPQAADNGGRWVGAWATALYGQANAKRAFATDTTLRQIVHVSVGGSSIRIVLSNEFGTTDLRIGGVTVARPATNAEKAAETFMDSGIRPSRAVQPDSVVVVKFGGRGEFTIPPGALFISDPISMQLAPLSDLAVTMYLPGQTIDSISYHDWADQTSFDAPDNQLGAIEIQSAQQVRSWRFLKGIDVRGQAQGAIVAFGDSITDGAPSKLNANHRYPDILAARLQGNPATVHLGVLNAGIGGNSVLHDAGFTGPNALARFDRDVIARAGVRFVIILEGINDIGRLQAPRQTSDVITADDLIGAYRQMIERAHWHGIKVFGATLTPYQGAHSDSDVGQAVRDTVNEFIRNGGEFDGVIDFAKTTADPANSRTYAAAMGTPDHLHPGDAGYIVMGESIDLALFTR